MHVAAADSEEASEDESEDGAEEESYMPAEGLPSLKQLHQLHVLINSNVAETESEKPGVNMPSWADVVKGESSDEDNVHGIGMINLHD